MTDTGSRYRINEGHERAAHCAALPDFLIAGATRCGTTSLHHYLSQHPDIFVAPAKELNFFYRDVLFNEGLDTYRRHFPSRNAAKAIGEASPMYWAHGMRRDLQDQYTFCRHDDSGSRIATLLPNVKTIITLRDPVRRAYSQFWRNYCRGRETTSSFLTALTEERSGHRVPEQTIRCWIYHNKYTEHLARWLSLFPRQNVKIIVFEEWIQSPEETYTQLCQFLGVDSTFIPEEFERRNAGWQPRSQVWADAVTPWLSKLPGLRRIDRWNRRRGYRELTRDEYLRASEYFQSEITELSKMLNRALPAWQFEHPQENKRA